MSSNNKQFCPYADGCYIASGRAFRKGMLEVIILKGDDNTANGQHYECEALAIVNETLSEYSKHNCSYLETINRVLRIEVNLRGLCNPK